MSKGTASAPEVQPHFAQIGVICIFCRKESGAIGF
jgi:hypothetical protein